MELHFRQNVLGLKIIIQEEMLENIKQIALRHYPKEYGGIFVGNYSEDRATALVTDTILPKQYKNSGFQFKRSSDYLNKKLKTLYEESKGEIFYIGEWHSHPNGAPKPSSTDLKAMAEIAISDKVTVDTPLLLIAGISLNEYNPRFYVYYNFNLKAYEKVD
jgi:integrative and conjugative element protein (TIGR02256 family)